MNPHDSEVYSTALSTWLDEHPFLSGNNIASSAVFEAYIAVNALFEEASQIVVDKELARGTKANPFISEFYFQRIAASSGVEAPVLPPEHVGVVYGSVRAGLALGDRASLALYGAESEDDERALEGDVEISVSRKGVEGQEVKAFTIEEAGKIRLGSYVEDVEIYSAFSDVEVGMGLEALLIAPISIQCNQIETSAQKWVIESSRSEENLISLEANVFSGPSLNKLPTLRGNVDLSVSWRDSHIHPWTSFSAPPSEVDDPRIEEGLRRFRKFIISFRSHSKGSLRRYKRKLEHERMTKGSGAQILQKLVSDGILTLEGNMYVLHPDELGNLAGSTYNDVYRRTFSQGAVDYIRNALPGG